MAVGGLLHAIVGVIFLARCLRKRGQGSAASLPGCDAGTEYCTYGLVVEGSTQHKVVGEGFFQVVVPLRGDGVARAAVDSAQSGT
jgi:hypothetical protein